MFDEDHLEGWVCGMGLGMIAPGGAFSEGIVSIGVEGL